MTKLLLACACVLLIPASAVAETEAQPTPDEIIAQMEADCAANSKAMAARQAEKSLFERLGGEEKIHEFTRELMSVHMKNDAVRPYVEGIDREKLASRLAQFIISGTGGPKVYEGPSLEDSHRAMGLTNQDFLVAGGDVIEAMKNVGYGQEEIDEMVCTLVALRSHVVLDENEEAAGAR